MLYWLAGTSTTLHRLGGDQWEVAFLKAMEHCLGAAQTLADILNVCEADVAWPLHAIANSEAARAKAEGKILGAHANPGEDWKPSVIRAKPAETPAAATYIPGLGEKKAMTKNQKKKAKRKTKKAGEN